MTNKSLAILFVGLMFIAGLSSCQYPEGPTLSIASVTNRISQEWEVLSATDSAGNDISDNYDEVEYDFEDDRDAEATLEIAGIPFEFEVTWDLDNDETIFELDLAQKDLSIVTVKKSYEILRLTRSEFWLKDQENGDELRLEIK